MTKQQEWVALVTSIHVNKYDYSLVTYTGIHSKVDIICPEHGIFKQSPQNHKKCGCPACGELKQLETKKQTIYPSRKKGRSYYIGKAKKKHNNMYNYSAVTNNDIGSKDAIVIICHDHGEFTQTVGDHIRGNGCPQCGQLSRINNTKKGKGFFVDTANNIHDYKYDYSLVSDNCKLKDYVEIICSDHGIFKQTFCAHIHKQTGCPHCGTLNRAKYRGSSAPENEIYDFLNILNVLVIKNDRNLIYPLELDFVLPDYNIAIEFNGLYWHSEKMGKGRQYHLNKTKICNNKGYQLLHIFEDEWVHKRNQVQRKLKHLLRKNDEDRVFARKCCYQEVPSADKKAFFDRHHIQGNGPGSITYGLYFDNQLIACMSFIKKLHGVYYLNRYATSCHVVGGFSKLLYYFKINNTWNKLISFADLRWSDGGLYINTNWTKDSILPPDYSYIKNNTRVHKFNYRRKYLPKLLKHFDPNLSETTNCDNNNVLRIWDCGKIKFIQTNRGYKK